MRIFYLNLGRKITYFTEFVERVKCLFAMRPIRQSVARIEAATAYMKIIARNMRQTSRSAELLYAMIDASQKDIYCRIWMSTGIPT